MEVRLIPRIARRVAAAGAAAVVVCTLGLAPAAAQAANGGSPPTGSPPPAAPAPAGGGTVLQGSGMWIWQLPRAGSVPGIVARARSAGVRTVFVKSADGTHRWGQFNASTVSALRRGGLHVCAWQYAYGSKPYAEATAGASAKQAGAECFVIDAESEYEGRYAAADQYMRRLRQLLGAAYPIAVAPFPYVDYHPGFPYSVFLGPGGAQADQPQMYWFSIGTSPDANFLHTYTWNRLYQRPIFPLGESWGRTPPTQIRRFRQLAQAYHARGVSWWEWTQTGAAAWRALSQPLVALTGYRLALSYPRLGLRSRGDPVVWAQEHLWSAGFHVSIDGGFGTATRNAVLAFQGQKGLSRSGALDAATWGALLRYSPVAVRWQTSRRATVARAVGGTLVASPPASASLPALAREIPPKPH
ncbi:MAG: hypothetical protein E6G30_08340 [Actinobacteria bacterium]|nr:MAG: hypothetical protein E6G30_08340 [Actinomycetota bacterium]